MKFFFHPKGIAVIGATPGKGKGGNLIVSNLKKSYPGRIYPVNPKYPEIEGLTSYPSVLDVPDPVDLAIVFVGARMVPEMIRACGERNIPGAMIQSAGFAEIGEEGRAIQAATLDIARQSGVRLWGPNCMGLVDARNRFVFSTVTPTLWDTGFPAGNLSLIVQSGMLSGAFLIDLMSHGITGISKVCSIGNKMDVNENDLLEYLMADTDTGVIGFYLESFADPRRFLDLARRSTKPLVMLNGGKTEKGAAAALSHTASLAADGAVVSGALAQAGIAEADDFYQLTDYGRTLAVYPEPAAPGGNRVAILTYTGGAGIVSADLMEKHDLAPAALSSTALKALESVFPEWMPPANPVDMWPGIILNGAEKAYGKAIEAVCADTGVDAVFAHCFVGGFGLEADLKAMADIAAAAGKPLFCWISGERQQVTDFQRLARRLGVPVFREITRAVECMALVLHRQPAAMAETLDLSGFAETASGGDPIREMETHTGEMDEQAAKRVFARCGIPVVEEGIAASAADARALAGRFGFPLVVKGLVPGCSHKTESNLVRLNISTQENLASAFADLERAMQGNGRVLIQKQVAGKIELVAGFVRDPQFGPCVMCGLGGIFAEAFHETVFGVAPLASKDVLNMLARLKCQDLLNGFRGIEPVDREAVARILVSLGDLGCRYPRIREIDINPLIVHNGLPVAVDGLILLSE